MSDHDADITARAIRANWPIIVAAVLGLIWAVRGEGHISSNEARLDKLEELVSVDGIAKYTADMSLIKHRLGQIEAEGCRAR